MAVVQPPGAQEGNCPPQTEAQTPPAPPLAHTQRKAQPHWQPLLWPLGTKPASSWTLYLRGKSPGIHQSECCLRFSPKPQTHDDGRLGPLTTWHGENFQVTGSLKELEVPVFSPSGLG